MGNAKKKKKDRDFKKVKLKVGKKLKKANATDTRIETKKVVLVEQLHADKNAEPPTASASSAPAHSIRSHRGLSLDELCRQLGHFNTNVRKDAIIGVTQLLGDNKQLMSKHLRTIIPSVARLIADGKNDTTTTNQLKALLKLVFTTSARIMSAHFELLVTHTLRAFTHIQLSVRVLALTVIVMLLRAYPQLCRDSRDLFDAFVRLMGSQRRPGSKELLLGALEEFVAVFTVVDRPRTDPVITAKIDFSKGRITRPLMLVPKVVEPFDFCVLGPSLKQKTSPLMTVEGFLQAVEAIIPLLIVIMSVEDGQSASPFTKRCIAVTKMLVEVLRSLEGTGNIEEMMPKIRMGFAPINKFVQEPLLAL
ncbi:hypothetical protein QR680_015165 [Steinernema hermaphroditum]|uniref:Pre-rRNA-processing protein Ipi1 N-terminal domain-containing protein n=1 Tax=Steinernema hermaphroditum TaxID=289476 RepID=A0AA39M5H5_9BILA|nr:hypothetical protein QR680_015165 [Steinernema hermaphroditum]